VPLFSHCGLAMPRLHLGSCRNARELFWSLGLPEVFFVGPSPPGRCVMAFPLVEKDDRCPQVFGAGMTSEMKFLKM